MIRGIRKTTSLRNLFTDSASGQIATLLTLAMVIVLMIVVANVKVGSLAARTTTLANAADSSALLLASQLSTKAYQLWDSLKDDPNDGKGATSKCQKSSFLSMLLGAIFAIIVIVVIVVLQQYEFLPALIASGKGLMVFMIASAATAGAMGGAVGAVASGTDILQGAAQGAAIGAAIGGIACGGYGLYDPSFFAPSAFAPATSSLSVVSTSTLWGAIGTGVMNLGSTIYTGISAAAALDKSLSQAAKALNGLPEKDIYREQVFLNALSQAVDDDPNSTSSQYVELYEDTDCDGIKDKYYCTDEDGDGDKENCDPHDANRNGDKNEAVSYFSYWWERRVKELKKAVPDRELMTNDFVFTDQSGIDGESCDKTVSGYNGYGDGRQPLSDFRNSAKASFTVQGREVHDGETSSFVWTPGSLYRRGLAEWRDYIICAGSYDYDCRDGLMDEPAAGTVVQVAEALKGIGVDVSFYLPGLTTRIGSECEDEDCLDEPYWDELEAVVGELAGFADIVDVLKGQEYQKLASTWDSWVRMFYDPDIYAGGTLIQENRDDYYDTLNALVNGQGGFNGLNAWRDEIVSKKRAYGNNFPQCEYAGEGFVGEIINAPCKVSGDCDSEDGCVVTTDSDAADDEFDKSITVIDGIIADIGVYRAKARNYYESMDDAYGDMETNYGGRNPVIYKWADSRCPKDSGDLDGDEDREETLPCHSVSVEVSDFRVPWVKKKKSGGFLTKKICLILTDYSDDTGANTWVTVSRADLAKQAVGGMLGSWNYCGSGGSDCVEDESLFGQRMFKTSRISKAKYSYNMVGIASTSW